MKNNQLIAVLLAILFVAAGDAAWLALKYNSAYHRHQDLQPTLASIRHTEQLISALIVDTVEYGKRNPAIDPILKSFNLMPGGNPAPAARPATK